MAKGKIAAAILSGMKGEPEEVAKEPEEDTGMGLESAMAELGAALAAEDWAGAAAAYKTAHQICSASYGDEE